MYMLTLHPCVRPKRKEKIHRDGGGGGGGGVEEKTSRRLM